MASEAQQETHLCGNCKREIPMVNFTIHEIHCRRNISVCKICKEPFPTSDMEEHMTSEHTPVTCKCKMTMEKHALEEHKRSVCPLRMVTCKFCELELACNKLQDHEDYCGARTEQCEKCGCSVMTKDLNVHPTECGKVKKPPRGHSWTDTDYEGAWFEPIARRNTYTDNLYSRMPKHLPSRFYGKSVLTQSFKTSEGEIAQNTGAAQNRVSEQPNLPRGILGEIWESFPEERPEPQRSFDTFQSISRPYNTVPDKPLPARAEEFLTDFYSKDDNKKTTTHRKSSLNHFFESVPLDMHSSSAAEDIQLPCEFCEELFPEQDLILHQSGCKPHLPSYDRPSPSPLLDFIEKPRSPPPPVDHSHSVFIPCEFCGVVMEGEILFHHQDQCDMGPNTGRSSPRVTAMLHEDLHAEDDWSSLDIPAASQLYQGLNTDKTADRYQVRETKLPHRARTQGGGLHTGANNAVLLRPSLEEMRKRNAEENPKLRSQHNDIHGDRDNRMRVKAKKNINVGTDDVDKEE